MCTGTLFPLEFGIMSVTSDYVLTICSISEFKTLCVISKGTLLVEFFWY